jgi:hypothetical protein
MLGSVRARQVAAAIRRLKPPEWNVANAGHDADGDFLCDRPYYDQSKVRKMTTSCVHILEMMDAKKADPEAKFAFSTIRGKR